MSQTDVIDLISRDDNTSITKDLLGSNSHVSYDHTLRNDAESSGNVSGNAYTSCNDNVSNNVLCIIDHQLNFLNELEYAILFKDSSIQWKTRDSQLVTAKMIINILNIKIWKNK